MPEQQGQGLHNIGSISKSTSSNPPSQQGSRSAQDIARDPDFDADFGSRGIGDPTAKPSTWGPTK